MPTQEELLAQLAEIADSARDASEAGRNVAQAFVNNSAAPTAIQALAAQVNAKAQEAITASVTASDLATGAANAVASGRVSKDTLAQLNAVLNYPEGAVGEVLADTEANSGLYRKVGASGAGSWVRVSGATISALDRRIAVTPGSVGEIVDDYGNIVARWTSQGLELGAGIIDYLQGKRVVLGGIETNDQGLSFWEIVDPEGKIFLRLTSAGLEIGKATIQQLVTPRIAFEAGEFSTETSEDVVWSIVDANGFAAAALLKDGTFRVSRLQADKIFSVEGGTAGYSRQEMMERSARALALSSAHRGRIESYATAPIYRYNHIIGYGQSLGYGSETWPAKTLASRPDVLMLGQSVRPGSNPGNFSAPPVGDSILRPAVATVQNGSGNLIPQDQWATLPVGDGAYGEEPVLAGIHLARRMMLQRQGVAADPDHLFVVSNVGVPGRSIEELSKGAAIELFSRLRSITTAVKNAAQAAGGDYGLSAVFFFGNEYNYLGINGTTDKAEFKTLLRALRNDIIADLGVAIAGQADPPAFITYQTGGSYSTDTLAVGEVQWELSQEEPGWYLAAPAYQFPDKGGHMDSNGSRWMALQMGKVYYETCVLRRGWKPLSPLQATYRSNEILIDFHVPHPPLQFKAVFYGQNLVTHTHKGFAATDALGEIPISLVEIVGDATVRIKSSRVLEGPVVVNYARKTGYIGHGNLCDSDPTLSPYNYEFSPGDYAAVNIAEYVGKPYPLWNWCIAFLIDAVQD